MPFRASSGFLGLCAALALGCNTRPSAAPPDGGGDVAVERPAPPTGRLSFDVVARLRDDASLPGMSHPLPGATLPATDAFTLILDAEAPRFIVGAGGAAQVVAATTQDGHTFVATAPFSVSRPPASTCLQGVESVGYRALEVTVDGMRLTGKAMGAASFVSGDVGVLLPFLAELEGGPDVTPPFVTAAGVVSSPFAGIELQASEPLPSTATARLVAADGSHVDLLPRLTDGQPAIVRGFGKPDVVLHPGGGYQVDVGGLVDFAGNTGAGGAPLRVAVLGDAPLVPEDGFESATATTVGGAGVLAGPTPPPITGAKSVYIASDGSGLPRPEGVAAGTKLAVRLARAPADTKVRFRYRLIAQGPGSGFYGFAVRAGSVDEAPAHVPAFPQAPSASQIAWTPAVTTAYATEVLEMEIPLAPSAAPEVLVSIEALVVTCGFGPPGTGMMIDDLRVE